VEEEEPVRPGRRRVRGRATRREGEIDTKATLCEIGVKKTGDGRISIMHFQKL
jgi:hypothetical protein